MGASNQGRINLGKRGLFKSILSRIVFPRNRISRTRFILSGGGLWHPGFCPFFFSWILLHFLFKFEFWINSFGLNHLGISLTFTQVTHLTLKLISFSLIYQNMAMEIFFLNEKYSFSLWNNLSVTSTLEQPSFFLPTKIWENSWIFFGPWQTSLCKIISWLFGIFCYRNLFSVLARKCMLWRKCTFP